MSTTLPPQEGSPELPTDAAVTAAAALSICESLLLALNDRNVLPEREIVGILHDAAAAHENHSQEAGKPDLHIAVALLINTIIDGGNSVRRP